MIARLLLALTAMLAALAGSLPASALTPTWGYRVVRSYPHDPAAFTEGLFFHNGQLFESAGLEGHSWVRRVDLATGRALQQATLPPQYFGEGSLVWGNRLIQLTWRSQIGFVFDLRTFRPISTFGYRGEGWALTTDGRRIIMSDGTPDLRFLDPVTLQETGRLRVTDEGRPVARLNELEWVNGEIFANIWETDRIARINPRTGQVTGWIDLTGLLPPEQRAGRQVDVLNGIAWDGRRLFVTGKLWPRLYQIELTPPGRRR